MRQLFGVVLMTALAAGSAGCDTTDTPTTPTTPVETITETFSGNLNTNGAQTFNFNTAAAGVVNAKLSSVQPDSNTKVGLALGTWNGITCNVVLANDNATQGITVIGNVSGVGSLCVRVYDVGQLTAPITFEVTVVHP